MIEDPETKQLLSRLQRRNMEVPRYVFSEVNFSLILMSLASERVSMDEICSEVQAKYDTVKKWRHGINKPRFRDSADRVVMLGEKYLMPEKMAECGVFTDEYRALKAKSA